MTDYSAKVELTKEEKEAALKQVPIGIHERVDPDTAWRRQQQKLLDDKIYREQQAKAFAASEATIAKQKARDAADAKAELLKRGWKKFPKHMEQFFHEDNCPFGCGETVAFLNHNSPYLKETDSLNTPFDRNHKDADNLNFDKVHLCSDLSGEKLTAVIHYLLRENLELRVKIVKTDQKARDYANLATMGPR